jgi:hypothetical protein
MGQKIRQQQASDAAYPDEKIDGHSWVIDLFFIHVKKGSRDFLSDELLCDSTA